jgi:hypothetical protein
MYKPVATEPAIAADENSQVTGSSVMYYELDKMQQLWIGMK